jgi:hypothetical protein
MRPSATRTSWRLVTVLAAWLTLCLAGAGYVWTRPTTYHAEAILTVLPGARPSAVADDAAVSSAMLTMVASGYVAYLNSGTALSGAAGSTGTPSAELARTTTSTLQPGTTNISVNVTAPTTETAIVRANAVAATAVERPGVRGIHALLIRPAAASTTTAGPARWSWTGAVVALAMVAALLLAAIIPPGAAPRRSRPGARTYVLVKATGRRS